MPRASVARPCEHRDVSERVLPLIVCVVGCSFTPGAVSGNGDASDATSDVPTDTSGDVPQGCTAWTVTPSGLDPCATPAPSGPLDLCSGGSFELSTDDGLINGATGPANTLLTSVTPNVRVVAVTNLSVCTGTSLHIVGVYPVAFVVHGGADIDGTINVSAWFDTSAAVWNAGPGGETACTSGTGSAGTASNDGAGGGAGGGFGGGGGGGGPGDVVAGVGGPGSEGSSLVPLRGGCAGGLGGTGDNTARGVRGRGGGAIQIAARDMIEITGTIRASGSGGGGGFGSDCGGGGGGAGGAILLESAIVSATGALCANGGGGGGGASDGGSFAPGGAGALGTCALSAAMEGSAGSGGGSAGGKGGFGATAAESGNGGSEGGGGGGGGVGRIRVRASGAPTLSGTITPPAT